MKIINALPNYKMVQPMPIASGSNMGNRII